MVAQRSRLKFTYEDYKQTPDDTRYELLDGELILAPVPRVTHQRTSVSIFTSLYSFVTEYEIAGTYGEGQTVISPLLPGFRLAVDDLF